MIEILVGIAAAVTILLGILAIYEKVVKPRRAKAKRLKSAEAAREGTRSILEGEEGRTPEQISSVSPSHPVGGSSAAEVVAARLEIEELCKAALDAIEVVLEWAGKPFNQNRSLATGELKDSIAALVAAKDDVVALDLPELVEQYYVVKEAARTAQVPLLLAEGDTGVEKGLVRLRGEVAALRMRIVELGMMGLP